MTFNMPYYYISIFVIKRDIVDKCTSKIYAFIDLPLIKRVMHTDIDVF